MADIDKLEAIARAATPGPWEAMHAGLGIGEKFVITEQFVRLPGDDVALAADVIDPNTNQPSEANAKHIAAFSPERAVPLLAVVRAASKVSAMNEDGGDSLVGEAFSLWFAQWRSAWATLRTALAALDALEDGK